MFVFRLNKIKILDNRERRKIWGIFGNNLAEVKIMSFVTTEFTDLPDLDTLIKTTDAAQQKAILEQLISTVISRRVLTTVENVKDLQTMTFGDTGFTVFFSDEIPEQFDWLLAVIESDSKARDEAKWLSDILKSKKFSGFTSDLILALKAAGKGTLLTNPAYLASVAIGKFAVDILLEKSKNNKDDQLGLLYMSLNRKQHYPYGKRDVQDASDLTGNMQVDYSLFGFKNPPPPTPPPPPKKTTPKKTKTKKTTPKKTTKTTTTTTKKGG
jgi:hypothetical protein